MAESLVSAELAIGILGLYLLALLGIGYYSYRQSLLTDLTDFFVVSRSLGVSVMVFTVLATILSTFFYLGIAGTFLGNGIGWIVVASWQIISALAILYGGSRIWKLGKKFDYITPAEMYSDYYDSDAVNILLPIVYTFAIFPFFVLQMRGGGLALDGITGGAISFEIGVTAFLIISVVYLLVGGARAVALTDLFQGVVFAIIIGIFFLLVVFSIGPSEIGEPVFRNVADSNPDNLTWPGGAGVFGAVATFSLLLGAGIGNLGQGPVFQRMFMANRVRTIKLTAVIYAILSVTLVVVIFYLTMASSLLVEPPENADLIFPVVLSQYAPIIGAIFVSGAIAAGMSTIDSNMITLSSFLTVDIVENSMPERFDERQLTLIGRGFIILLAIVAYFLALRTPATLTELALLVLQYSAVTLPPLIGPLIGWKHASREGMLASLIIGLVVATWATFVTADPLGIDATLWGIGTGTITFILVGYLTESVPEERRQRFKNAIYE